MKILCVIDSLGSGGAQRQMVNLACGLKDNGHEIEMFVYWPRGDFFRATLDNAGIPVHSVVKGRGFSFAVLLGLIALLRKKKFNGVISFLSSPNIYCELAILVSPNSKLIVSERSSSVSERSRFIALLRRLFHFTADYVVANSETHGAWLARHAWLRKKVITIYNGYPVFSQDRFVSNDPEGKLRFLVVGRIHPCKNGLRLIEALSLFYSKHGSCPIVSWAGRRETDVDSCEYIEKMEEVLERNPEVKANWNWLGERNDVPDLLATHDALLHLSLYEGLPNGVCEAFFAQCPVIASNVCDHPLLVEDGVRGLLCDPLSIESICAVIERFEALGAPRRAKLAFNARKYAEEKLSIERMVNAYEGLLKGC